MSKRAVIIGGTGQIGHATAEALLMAGWEVTLASRGQRAHSPPLPPGARSALFDRDAPGALRELLAQGADAVIDTIAFDETHARRLLEVQQDIGAIVAISSISVYCDAAGRTLDEARDFETSPRLPGAVRETQATTPPGPATYSTRKVAMENALLQNARIPVTILRPGAIHGPYSPHPREWWFVKRLLDGRKKIPLKYHGKSLFSHISAGNIARLTEFVLAKPKTHILNAVDEDALSVAEIGRTVAAELQIDCSFALLDEFPENSDVGSTPWSTRFPFLASGAAAAELGFEAWPYAATLPGYCSWMTGAAAAGDWRAAFPVSASYADEAFNYAAEDRYFALQER